MNSIFATFRRPLRRVTGIAVAAGAVAIAFVLGGALTPPALRAAEREPFKVVDGDGWLTSNANYDGDVWSPTDVARPSFGLQLSERNDLPFDRGTAGATVWVRNGSCGAHFRGFGDPCGWQLGLAVTQFRSIVVGGQGMEVDGLGLPPPYARFVNSSYAGTRMEGLLTNAFVDLSGVDDAKSPSWFSGFDLGRDAFAVRRAAPGTRAFAELLSVDAAGNATASGDIAARHIVQRPANRWATRAHLTRGSYTFRYDAAFAQTPVCVATSEGAARVRVTPTATQCTVTSDDAKDGATVDVMVIGNPG
jgi:hypothetical protein